MAAVVLFLVLAAPHVRWRTGRRTAVWVRGRGRGAAIVCFFAYSASTRCRRRGGSAGANRDVPVGIIGRVCLTALYSRVAAVLTGVVPYLELNNAEPVAYALRSVGNNFGGALVAAGAARARDWRGLFFARRTAGHFLRV
jgi:APA family basic amino acid/polyamine antiporter